MSVFRSKNEGIPQGMVHFVGEDFTHGGAGQRGCGEAQRMFEKRCAGGFGEAANGGEVKGSGQLHPLKCHPRCGRRMDRTRGCIRSVDDPIELAAHDTDANERHGFVHTRSGRRG